jgi:AraC family transcriptional regulator, transcriptional activator of pobA
MSKLNKIESISELHRLLGCGKPKHPGVSIVKYADIDIPKEIYGQKFIFNFYVVSLKEKYGELKYGHHYYDFEEGTLICTSPGQVITPIQRQRTEKQFGWALYFHPDILRASGLGDRMNNYSFFSYTSNEALHLSEDEKQTITDCILKIKKEYSQNIDQHSQNLIVSNIELLLNYCTRFYDRQFITRAPHNKDHITQFEEFLSKYYTSDLPKKKGLPSVAQCAEAVN